MALSWQVDAADTNAQAPVGNSFHDVGVIIGNTPEQLEAAARIVAGNAMDADVLQMLLEALGLQPPEPHVRLLVQAADLADGVVHYVHTRDRAACHNLLTALTITQLRVLAVVLADRIHDRGARMNAARQLRVVTDEPPHLRASTSSPNGSSSRWRSSATARGTTATPATSPTSAAPCKAH